MPLFSGFVPRPPRLPVLALALLCACGGASAKDVITLCFERQQVLPWRTLDQKGLNFELLDEVATRVGIRFDYQSMPWKRCLAQLKANEVGGAFAVSFSPERMDIGAYPGVAWPGAARPGAARLRAASGRRANSGARSSSCSSAPSSS
jgi:polar amino acid transport system substrate-binding protein